MAADSDLDKTEPATPRRLEKAREEGQVARSRELTTFLILATGAAALWLGGMLGYEQLSGVLKRGLVFDPRVGRDTQVMLNHAAGGVADALLALLPLFALLAGAAVLGAVMLGGLVFSGKAVQPQFGRMNLFKGLARITSAHTLVELAKTLMKATLVGGVSVLVLWHYHDDLLSLMHAAPAVALPRAMHLVALCAVLIVASLAVLVLIDAPWQLYSHTKKLRMSKQDLREENKESEGDPHVKGRIRQQQRAMARQRMMAAVPDADVVVTNPTHYAVALRYDEGGSAAPTVVAKGAGLIAQRIRDLAVEHRVPLLSAPPLARALHHHVELGEEIPAALYTAVAEVLAWVFQLRAWQPATGAPQPTQPQALAVPAELDPGQNPNPNPHKTPRRSRTLTSIAGHAVT